MSQVLFYRPGIINFYLEYINWYRPEFFVEPCRGSPEALDDGRGNSLTGAEIKASFKPLYFFHVSDDRWETKLYMNF
jgi:hypothetical protein